MDRVVVAVDGTAAGEAAIGWAIARAAHSAPVSIEVTAVYDPLPSESVLASRDFKPVFEHLLDASAARIGREAPGLEVTTRLRTGHPRLELAAASQDASLLVVGTVRDRADGGYDSVPVRLAGTTRCPTVVVPAEWRSSGGPVVVGLDATEQQPTLLGFARGEALSTGRELVVVHSWSVPTLLAVVMFAHPGVWENIRASHERALEETLRTLRAETPDLVVRERLREGAAARVLADAAEGADLLVVGRHGRASAGETLLGSTGHGLLLELPCPVVVVPE